MTEPDDLQAYARERAFTLAEELFRVVALLQEEDAGNQVFDCSIPETDEPNLFH